MRRNAGLVFITSFGLTLACGDNSGQTTENPTTVAPSTTNMQSTTDGTGTATGTSAPTTGQPTSSVGESMTSDPTPGTTDSPGTTSGVVMTTTEGSATDAMTSTTTDGTTSGGMSTSSDVSSSSTSTTSGMMTSMSSSGGGSTMDMPCDEIKVTLKPIVPSMQLVLDKSGSMLTLWDHDANPNTATVTRWFSLYAVVDKLLTNFNAKFNFGMNLFPSKSANGNYNSGACPVNANVEVPVSPLNKDAILAVLPAQNNMTIKGGTPAAAGMTAAVNHLKTLDPMSPRLIALITDGAANCAANAIPPPLFEMYDQTVHTVVDNAFKVDKIPTYVIGIATANMVSPVVMDGNPDGINPYTKLNELAVLGGKPKNNPNEKFYNANNQIELDAALDAIITDAQSCVIPLDVEPGFPEFTKVKIGGVLIPKIMNCGNQNGWKYVDPAPPYAAIELCGTACASLKQTGAADVEYYCMPG